MDQMTIFNMSEMSLILTNPKGIITRLCSFLMEVFLFFSIIIISRRQLFSGKESKRNPSVPVHQKLLARQIFNPRVGRDQKEEQTRHQISADVVPPTGDC